MEKIIEVKNIVKIYKDNVRVLDDVSYVFAEGKFYAVMGRSGAGKSTLLNIIGTIDDATDGQVLIKGKAVTALSEKEKARLRAESLGFVFQGFYLNPHLSAIDNVIVPMKLNRDIPAKDRRKRALELLEQFGVGKQAHSLPSQLSGGEQQRVCIARALANHPEIILADEPTGNLDEENEKVVFAYLKQLAGQGHTVIVVSHNEMVKKYADEVIVMG